MDMLRPVITRHIQSMQIDDWKTNRSIDKLVNGYRLVLVNRWSIIDDHTKTVHQLLSIGTATLNRRHTRYLPDHLPFLGSPRDEIGKTIPTQSTQRKEYTLLHKRGVRVALSNPNLLSVLQTS